MSNRQGSYGGYTTPRGRPSPRGQFILPNPRQVWGYPGYGRTEFGFRTRPGDNMAGANFWQPENPHRNQYYDYSRGYPSIPPNGRYSKGSSKEQSKRRKDKGKSTEEQPKRDEKEENKGLDEGEDVDTREKAEMRPDKDDVEDNESSVPADYTSKEEGPRFGERLQRIGQHLLQLPGSDEEKRRVSTLVEKCFEDARRQIGEQTLVDMFKELKEGEADYEAGIVTDDTEAGATGGAHDVPSEVRDIYIEKEISTKPKHTTPYRDEALHRLGFFNEEGEQKGARSNKESLHQKGNTTSIRKEDGDTTTNKSPGATKPMTTREKALVDTVIGDIIDGRTEYGCRMWRDIRERVLTDRTALIVISEFFRKQYNEGISKQQAEYCCIKLQNFVPKQESYGERQRRAENSEEEHDDDDLFEDEVIDQLSKVAYDGDKEEAKKAALKRSRCSPSDSDDIVPKELLDYKVGSFTTIEDYKDYMKEVTRKMLENMAIVEEKCKVNTINDKRKSLERSSREHSNRTDRERTEPERSSGVGRERSDIDREGEHEPSSRAGRERSDPPESNQRTARTSGRRLQWGTSTGNGDGTYTLEGGRRGTHTGDRRGERYSSTPRAQTNPNHDDSIWSDNMGLTARELSIYEQYDVPLDIRRPSHISDTSNPLLSSTVVGDQTTGNMQSLFSMVPTGSNLDMFRPFDGLKSSFLEWKHETQILLRNLPELLRPIKLKSLLNDSHKKLLGHIYHDDPNAIEKIWVVLTQNFGGSMDSVDYHMDKLTGWMRDGRRCHDYESLSHLYNFIKTHYYGMARLGADKIPMAESFAYAIAPLLYGKSQREVNKLKHKDAFNVNKILDIIAEHAKEVKAQEEDQEKYEHRSEQYSEEDKKFLRGRYFEENRSRWDYTNKRYNKSYRSRYSTPERGEYKSKRDTSMDRPYREVNRYHKNRYNSRDRSSDYRDERYKSGSRDRYSYKYNSRDRYRDDSKDRHTHKFRRNRSYSSDRESADDIRKYHKNNAYKKERHRNSKERHIRDESDSDQEPVVLKTEIDEESHVEERPRYRRSRDQTPRGSRSKSPLRKPGSRSWNSWGCTLCLKDDHKTINCHNYTAEEVYRICNERKLCYICNLTGHMASVCNAENLLCKSGSCKQDVRHNNLLCDIYKK